MNAKAKLLTPLLLIICFSIISPTSFATDEYWPTAGWQTSTPEEQGMDSEKILKMLEFFQKQQTPIHSVLIIRHGFLVTEAYFAP